MYGWNVHDGNYFIDMDLTLATDETMTSDEYDLWWSRFRGLGFEAERTDNLWAESDFSTYGSSSAAYMAAEDVVTTSMYSCGVYALIENAPDSDSADIYAYIFDDRSQTSATSFVNHGDELGYILQETAGSDTIST
jgi:carboxylesterase type B